MVDDISLEPLLNLRTAPVQGYQISDQVTGTTSYYGYVNKRGHWYIMKSVITGSEINYTYTNGNDSYTANWALRGSLSYANFAIVF